MTRSRGAVRGSLRSGRWLLPWILVLLVSATFAYTMNSAVTGALANPDGRLEASPNRDAVHTLYDEAGLGLEADLQTLAGAPRVNADADAVSYLRQNVPVTGKIRVPVLTLHTTGDGLVPVPNEEAYASAVRAAGGEDLLRQIFVQRAGHCQFTPAERTTAIRSLVRRLDAGLWEGLDPDALSGNAAALGSQWNALTTSDPPVATQPAFVSSTPAVYHVH